MKEVLYKYILQFLIILLILRMVPYSSTFDKILISSIVILLFYLFDIKVLTMEKLTNISNQNEKLNEEQKLENVRVQKHNELIKQEHEQKMNSILTEILEKPEISTNKINEDDKTRNETGVITDETKYDDYFTVHNIHVGEDYKSAPEDYGYSFLPPEKWFPINPHPPVCSTNKKCDVCPYMTTGYPVDIKEWNESRRITQPDNINVDYIKDKLNSGK